MPPRNFIKLSAPATKEFWKIPVVFEDETLLALDKPTPRNAEVQSDDLPIEMWWSLFLLVHPWL